MITYEVMTIEMYDELITFWSSIEMLGLGDDDAKDRIAWFLEGNNGLSRVARKEGKIVGAVMCGHDFRRGHIYHLAVDKSMRRQGIGSKLLTLCVDGLRERGIRKIALIMLAANQQAYEFYINENWTHRGDLKVFSKFC